MNLPILTLALTAAAFPAAPAEAPKPTVIVLRPAASPVPALKYHLVPERRALVAGNAAVFYHRAIEMLLQTRQNRQAEPNARGKDHEKAKGDDKGRGPTLPESSEMAIARWANGPLNDVPREAARGQLEAYKNALNEVELGAWRQACDWEFDLRREGFQLLLPEIMEMRSLGRLVTLRARLAVLDGKTDEALHWIEIGQAMARHVSQGPTLMQALVGLAMSRQTTAALEDLIQAPGTPSLYWCLANRPRPFIDLAAAMDGERNILERELPTLRELDGGPWTVEKARQFTDDLIRKLSALTGVPTLPAGAPGLSGMGSRLAMAANVAKIYPGAKRALIAQGRPAAEVEAMPAVQVAAIATIQSYYEWRDDIHKWLGLPYWQAYNGMNEASRKAGSRPATDNPLLAVVMMLIPAYNSAVLASVRVDRQLDALQCVEAIRLHAEAHGGALPASLDAITEAPVPVDPATGKPFDYQLKGTTATLSAPIPPGAPNHPSYALRYELKPAR